MQVKEIMTREPVTCRPESDLRQVGVQMWENDCGIIPVVEDAGKVVGVVTDRDLCVSLCTKSKAPAQVTVKETMTRSAHTCAPEDDVIDAMAIMRRERIRRLPVTDSAGILQGVLSINDVVLAWSGQRGDYEFDIDRGEILSTLAAICEHWKGPVPTDVPLDRKAGTQASGGGRT